MGAPDLTPFAPHRLRPLSPTFLHMGPCMLVLTGGLRPHDVPWCTEHPGMPLFFARKQASAKREIWFAQMVLDERWTELRLVTVLINSLLWKLTLVSWHIYFLFRICREDWKISLLFHYWPSEELASEILVSFWVGFTQPPLACTVAAVSRKTTTAPPSRPGCLCLELGALPTEF